MEQQILQLMQVLQNGWPPSVHKMPPTSRTAATKLARCRPVRQLSSKGLRSSSRRKSDAKCLNLKRPTCAVCREQNVTRNHSCIARQLRMRWQLGVQSLSTCTCRPTVRQGVSTRLDAQPASTDHSDPQCAAADSRHHAGAAEHRHRHCYPRATSSRRHHCRAQWYGGTPSLDSRLL